MHRLGNFLLCVVVGAYSIPSLDVVYGNLYGEGGMTVLPLYCTTPRIAMWTDEPAGMWASHFKSDCDYHLYDLSTPGPGHLIMFNAVTFPSGVTVPTRPQHRPQQQENP